MKSNPPQPTKTITAAALLALIVAFAPLSSFADEATSSTDQSSSTPTSQSATTDLSSTTRPDQMASSAPAIVVNMSSSTEPVIVDTGPTPDSLANPDVASSTASSTTPADASATTTVDNNSTSTDTTSTTASGGGGGNNIVTPIGYGEMVYIFPPSNDGYGYDALASSTSTTFPTPTTVAPDIAPPVNISWQTSVPGTSVVLYSTSTSPINLASQFTPSVSNDTLTTAHAVQLTGLLVDTPYDIVYQSRDASGNLIISNFMSLDIQTASSTEAATSTMSVAAMPFSSQSESSTLISTTPSGTEASSASSPASTSAPETDNEVGTTTFFENTQVSP